MNLVDAFLSIALCVFLHTLYCLIHCWPIREEFFLWNSFSQEIFWRFLQNHNSWIYLNMGYLCWPLHAPSSVSARQVPSWRHGTQDKLILAARWQELISLAPSLHQVIFLQVELQYRIFHCREHKPNIFGICGAREVGINNFLCVGIQVYKHT